MREIIPTVFAHNKKEFDERFAKLIKISKKIQIDFMDGKFVEARGLGLQDIPNLRKYRNEFEAHLMVKNPEDWISELKEKGFKKIIFHFESVMDINKISGIVSEIDSKRMEPWIAFNPNTDFYEVVRTAREVYGLKGIMFMSVMPGREGQEIEVNTYRKIMNFKKEFPKIKVQVDGGVNDRTIDKLNGAGADIANTGGFVANAVNPREALEVLKKKFK